MKKVILSLCLLTSVSSFASTKTMCLTTKLSALDFINAVSSSESLSILKGPHRDVSMIEVFAISDNGRSAKMNITYSGTVGQGETVTYQANKNCDARGRIELE